MDNCALVSILTDGSFGDDRHYKDHVADVIEQGKLQAEAMNCAHNMAQKTYWRAAWGLETLFLRDKKSFIPFIPLFISYFLATEHESVRRHYAKIGYYILKDKLYIPSTTQAAEMATAYVEWIMCPKAKVGMKVWAIDALFLLRAQVQWIEEILPDILERERINSSSGMRLRLRKLPPI